MTCYVIYYKLFFRVISEVIQAGPPSCQLVQELLAGGEDYEVLQLHPRVSSLPTPYLSAPPLAGVGSCGGSHNGSTALTHR